MKIASKLVEQCGSGATFT